ncbi:type 4a pilus biogenesis protein PilO [Gracilimonas tropica]|uniref:type 4a pilus biogenesis protein PilO n=1 Tax=Gracilimonas tropica TaxID=454600 RepID=UPI00036753A8|nr:type 4a pilus biogenesis protein PilO [Gracilimonas tropica]
MVQNIKYRWRWLAGILAGVFLVLFGFVLLPYASVVYKKATLLGEQKEQISFMSNWQERLAILEERQNRLDTGMQQMVINLAKQEEFSKVIETFFEYAESSVIDIKRIQPVSESVGDEYMTRQLRLKVEGNYHGIARFVNKLEQGSYLVTTKTIALETNSESNELISGAVELEVTLLGEPE